MVELEIKLKKDKPGLSLGVQTKCKAILFLKVFVNMEKPNLAFFQYGSYYRSA